MNDRHRYLDQLTPEQRAAATYMDGPLRIIAGAGTGKTGTITSRYCYLVHQGIDPARILTLTFSTKAAGEMRARILGELGTVRGRLSIQTFHAFWRQLLVEWSRPAQSPRIIPDLERIRYLQSAVDSAPDGGWRFYRGVAGGNALVRDLKTFVDRAQDDLLSPDRLEQQVTESKRMTPRLSDLIIAYREYLDILRSTGLFDFNALGTTVIERLSADPEIQRQTRDRFDHLLVDEFQDTNKSQYEFMKLVAPKTNQVCVVGDSNQAIYAFRGGRSEYLERFTSDFPNVRTVRLEQNFRSRRAILAAANSLARQIEPETIQLVAHRTDDPGEVTVRKCADPTDEAETICSRILRLLTDSDRQLRPSDIAVLFRSVTNLADPLIRAMTDYGIPHTVRTAVAARAPFLLPLLAMLRLIAFDANWSDATVVAVRFGADAMVCAGIERKCDRSELSDIVRGRLLPSRLERPDERAFLETVFAAIDDVRKLAGATIAITAFNALGALGQLSAETSPTDAVQFRELIDLASEMDRDGASIGDYLTAIANSSRTESEQSGTGSGVQIMTMHAAKGLEWPVVFVAGLAETLFPAPLRKDRDLDAIALVRGSISTETAEAEHAAQSLYLREERRLAYVAVTRARDQLHLTWPSSDGSQKLERSRFVAELGPTVQDETADDIDTESARTLPELRRRLRRSTLAAGSTPIGSPDSVAALTAMIVAQWAGNGGVPGAVPLRDRPVPVPNEESTRLAFSFSGLDTYNECHRKFMYSQVLRLGKDESGHSLALGNGVHAALDILNHAWMESGQIPDEREIDAALTSSWPTDEFDFRALSDQLLKRAQAMIKRYFAWEATRIPQRRPIAVEQSMNEPRQGHQLRGRIDLILSDDANGSEIIDFKTGVPGNYKPAESLQLFLYAQAWSAKNGTGSPVPPKAAYIALKHDNDKAFRTGEAFDAKQYKTIEYTEETIELLNAQVDDLLAGILANDFQPNPGTACRFCQCRWICPAGMEAD